MLNDSPDFEDRITEQQEHYRRLAIRGYIALANLHEQQQQYGDALEALNRALAFDPLQEDVQRSALRLHYLAGDRPGAIRRYEVLRKLLDEEMGVPPMAETRALYDEIISDQGMGKRDQLIRDQGSEIRVQDAIDNQQSTINNLPFTGRETELAKLNEAVTSPNWPSSKRTRHRKNAPGRRVFAWATGRTLPQRGARVGTWPALSARHRCAARLVCDIRLAGAAPTNPLPDVWLTELARLVPEINLIDDRTTRKTTLTADESRLWESVHQFLLELSRLTTVVVFLVMRSGRIIRHWACWAIWRAS